MTRSSKGSISAHPLFPAIVALWFAALLGIGSLILPVALFDRLAAMGGDVSLSMTMRTVVAIVAALGGAGLGMMLARKVAATPAPRARAHTRQMDTKRPISALEELGPEGLDEPLAESTPPVPAPEPIPGRRRPLSVTDETGPSEFLDHAPLPGTGHGLDMVDHDHASEEDALELGAFEQQPKAAAEPFAAPDDVRFGSGGLSESPAADPLAAPIQRHTILRPEAAAESDAAPFAPPAAPATGRPAFGMPQPVAVEEPAEPAPEPAPEAVSPIATRPLHDLGMVELVERFALSLQSAARAAAPVATEPPVEAAPMRFAPPAPVIPAALRPIGFGDDLHDEREEEPDLAFRIAPVPAPFAAPMASLPDDDEAGDDDSFASLLAMRGKLGDTRESIRVEDEASSADIEPVVVFPGHEARRAVPAADGPSRDAGVSVASDFSRPAPFAAPVQRAGDPGATEAALRDALAKLQRISGAA